MPAEVQPLPEPGIVSESYEVPVVRGVPCLAKGGAMWAWFAQASHTKAFLFAIDFHGRNNGRVVGELDRSPGSDPWAYGIVLTTTNGGTDWGRSL